MIHPTVDSHWRSRKVTTAFLTVSPCRIGLIHGVIWHWSVAVPICRFCACSLGEPVAAPKLRPRCLRLRCRSASRVRFGEYVSYGAGYGVGAIDGYEGGGVGDRVELG